MKEKINLEIGQSVENLTEEQIQALKANLNPDELGFDGVEGLSEDETD